MTIQHKGYREPADGQAGDKPWAANPSRYLAAPATALDVPWARIRRCRVAHRLPLSLHQYRRTSCVFGAWWS